MKSIFKRIVITLLILIIGAGVTAKLYFDKQIDAVNNVNSSTIMVEIPKGSSTSRIANLLKQHDLIKNDLAFRILNKLLKTDGKIKAGTYELSGSMTAEDIIYRLVNGQVVNISSKFTIPEGFEFRQIVSRLADKGLIDKDEFIQIANYGDFPYEFLQNIPKGENRLEGFLFPDTYEVNKDITEEELIIKMLDRFNQIFEEQYYQRAMELNMSVNDVITLASIIEREAKLDNERALVSSVFHNRIKKNMLIQSCATVQYILGERKENLTYNDLAIDSPYNTYKYSGLPPKPIASPGRPSILAALYPEESSYLYFVLDENGKHIFSKTYQEHLNAKNGN